MFALTLRQANHVRRYSIARTGLLGWEIRLRGGLEAAAARPLPGLAPRGAGARAVRAETSQLQESGWRGDRSSVDEPIAEADDRLDLAARRAELAAQAADVHVDRSRFHLPVVAPDPLEQPVARHDPVLVLTR